MINRTLLLTLSLMLGLATGANTFAKQAVVAPTAELRQSAVYLLGVDARRTGAERLRRALTPSNDSRWALTDYVHQIAAQMSAEVIPLSSRIENWNPAEDPYNFGAVTVQQVDHNTTSWSDGQSRTYVSVNLGWIHIGHEIGTRYARDKTPEIRFAVSEYYIAPFESRQPPGAAQLDRYYQRAFDSALENLLRKVTVQYQRQVKRDLTEIRYVQVATPIVLAQAGQQLSDNYAHTDVDALQRNVPLWVASFLEDELMERFQADPRFNPIVLLPNLELADYIVSEWPAFASRVQSESAYSANFAAIGIQAPQLLKLVPLCEQALAADAERSVPGFEVRSNLVSIRMTRELLSPGVELVTQTPFIAADIKLPLSAEHALQGLELAEPLPALIARYTWDAKKSDKISLDDWLGPHLVPANLANVVEVLANDLAERLLLSIDSFPHLSHPSIKRKCE